MRLELVARLSQAVIDPALPRWRSPPTGGSVRLQEDGTTVVCSAAAGWSHVILDRWFARGVASVMLKVEEDADDLFIGVVGSNFHSYPREWEPPLSESRHAVVAHAGTGKVYAKGSPSLLALPLPIEQAAQLRRQRQQQLAGSGGANCHSVAGEPLAARRCVVRSGSVVHLIADMERHELTIEVFSSEKASYADVQSSVVIEGLPAEVGVAVGFGAGEQRVRLLGINVEEKFRSHSTPARKMIPDLWDDYHVVTPLRSTRSRRSRDLSDQLQHGLEIVSIARES